MSDHKRTDAVQYQPDPTMANGDIWNEVLEDMEARREMGIDKYGTPLQAFNGRKPLVDLYQELLDAVVYIKQKILEDEEKEFILIEDVNYTKAIHYIPEYDEPFHFYID